MMKAVISPAAISSALPTSSSHSAANRLELIAARVISEMTAVEARDDDILYPHTDADYYSHEKGRETAEESESDDFEFSFECRDPEAEPVTADELFTDGHIRPGLFPIFNSDVLVFHQNRPTGVEDLPSKLPRTTVRLPLRKLMTAGGGGDKYPRPLEGVPAGDYCVWTPASAPASPDGRCKKSKSTGSTKRWRLRDLLHRSGSDGKDTIVFLSTEASTAGRQERSKVVVKASKEAKPATMAAKLIPSPASGSQLEKYIRERAMREGGRRRSYLPYKQDIVGFFSNVNGLSRPHHRLTRFGLPNY